MDITLPDLKPDLYLTQNLFVYYIYIYIYINGNYIHTINYTKNHI